MIKNQVYWQTLRTHEERPLLSNQSSDVVVVGGGMAGLAAAKALADAGKKVIVLEQDFCGSGASGKSSGFITPDSELELSSLIKEYGPEKARKLWEFSAAGVKLIKRIAGESHFDCDFRIQDSLFIANSRKKFISRIQKEHEARKQLGYESILYPREELPYVIGSSAYYGGVRYPNTFGIDAFAFCQEFKKALLLQGVQIYEKSPVTRIGASSVESRGYTVNAGHIVLCTDRFLPKLGIQKPNVYQAQTFLGLTKPLPPEVMRAIFLKDQLMVWDTDLIYQYYRVVREDRLLIGASSLLYTYLPLEIHMPQNVVHTMRQYFKAKYPSLKLEMEYFWPGMIGVSKDFVPVAGQDPKNPNLYFIAAATGLPWAASLGTYIAEKILSGRDDFDPYFSPQRKYPIGKAIQHIIRKPFAFALSHGIVKYFK